MTRRRPSAPVKPAAEGAEGAHARLPPKGYALTNAAQPGNGDRVFCLPACHQATGRWWLADADTWLLERGRHLIARPVSRPRRARGKR